KPFFLTARAARADIGRRPPRPRSLTAFPDGGRPSGRHREGGGQDVTTRSRELSTTGGSEMRTKAGPFALALTVALLCPMAAGRLARADTTTRSSSIALNKAGSRLFSVNFEANSVTVFDVGKGGADLTKTDEVAVGREPVCVAVAGQKAYVTNSASGTV